MPLPRASRSPALEAQHGVKNRRAVISKLKSLLEFPGTNSKEDFLGVSTHSQPLKSAGGLSEDSLCGKRHLHALWTAWEQLSAPLSLTAKNSHPGGKAEHTPDFGQVPLLQGGPGKTSFTRAVTLSECPALITRLLAEPQGTCQDTELLRFSPLSDSGLVLPLARG